MDDTQSGLTGQPGSSAGQPRQLDMNAIYRPLPDTPQSPRSDSADRKRQSVMYEEGRRYPYGMSSTQQPPYRQQPHERLAGISSTQHSPYGQRPPEDLAARILPQFRPRNNSPTMSDILGNVPLWQPDEDVQKCPVCSQEFTLFFRKHHCRKCGNVVCGLCSQHRITVPLRYVAQPPWAAESASQYLTGSAPVRVCNPCVPDPWQPQQQQQPPPVSPPETRPRPSSNRFSLPPPPTGPPHHRHRHSSSLSNPPPYEYWQADPRVQQGSPLVRRPLNAVQNQQSSPGSLEARLRFSGTSAVPVRPTPPRRVVKEEDECPVCGIALPPGETLRELHITGCVTTRFGGDTARNATPPRDDGQEVQASSSLPTDNARVRSQSYRSRGLCQYKATEKDCIDGDGQEQECPICFEEFQPGETLGRLECLCRFHHACIREWWVRKGPGMCPVHASHE